MVFRFLKSNWPFTSIVLVIFFGYFLLRVPALTLQPIFADEAIYIRWAQVIKSEPTLRFLPLSDGKTPLFMWVLTELFDIFDDPLFAGRFLSVLSGFVTLLGVIFLGCKFFRKEVGLWAGFLYAITPYFVFFDRMALVDSMLAAFSIWSLNFALLLARYSRIDIAMFLGYLLGGSLLTKTPGFFNIFVLPATAILLNWSSASRERSILKLVGLWLVATFIALFMYNLLRLGPGFDNLNSRNQDYVFTPERLITYPLDPFLPHLNDLSEWFIKLLGIPLVALIFYGIILTFYRRNKILIVLLFWSLVPILINMALLKTFTSRYILFSIPPLICIAAFTAAYFSGIFKRSKTFCALLACILISWPAYFSYNLLRDPKGAPIPVNDRIGYFEDWTAGYGLREIAAYIKEESLKEMVVVGVEGTFGTLPDGLQIYFDKNPSVVIIGGPPRITPELRQASLDHPTFFVANKSRYGSFEAGLTLVREYPKASRGENIDAMLLFKVEPER